jgi:hypothetical protein
MPKVHQVSEAEVKENSMLDYYVVVRREDNKEFIAGYRFEGYSGNAMWDEVKDIRRAYETNVSSPVIVEW